MTKFLISIVFFGLMLGGIASLLFCTYFFHRMLREVKPEQKILMQLLGPFALALPHLWTEKGNEARVRTILWTAIFLLCFGGVATVITITAP
jgi:hypothetical protein